MQQRHCKNQLKRVMNIIHLRGGLGNQMFQYALYLSFIEKGIPAYLDLSHYSKDGSTRGYELETVFGIKAPAVPAAVKLASKLRWKLFHRFYKTAYKETENGFGFYDKQVAALRSAYLKGYWQSEKYFANATVAVRNSFSFTDASDEENKRLLSMVKNNSSVSIHIRRGDYAGSSENLILPLSYYQQAIDFVSEKIDTPVFVVFSDDPAWAEQHLHLRNAVFVNHNKGNNSYRDMQLMSNCSHNIIANSSFSWWAAWLNQNAHKVVIAPSQWLQWMEGTRDIIPSTWIKIPIRSTGTD